MTDIHRQNSIETDNAAADRVDNQLRSNQFPKFFPLKCLHYSKKRYSLKIADKEVAETYVSNNPNA